MSRLTLLALTIAATVAYLVLACWLLEVVTGGDLP